MYQNGKIYKITCDLTDKIYIGSTCNPLYKRHDGHKHKYRQFINGKYHNVSSFELIKLGDTVITLIEDFPCDRKEQLNARERYHIELNRNICVNKNIPTRTQKERRTENPENHQEQNRKWVEKNPEKEKERLKKYRDLNKLIKINCECGSTISKLKKFRHEKTKKHLAFIETSN